TAAGPLEKLAALDRLDHVLGLLAVDAAVLELDRGVAILPGHADQLGPVLPLPRHRRARDDLVLDPSLLQRLLHPPAGMPAELDPLGGAAVELHGHRFTITPDKPPGRNRP